MTRAIPSPSPATTPAPTHDPAPRLGPKVRAIRRRAELSQARLAEQLGISSSYLNLIEHNRRPLPAGLMIKLAQLLGIQLDAFASDEDARLVAELLEVFSDPLFNDQGLSSTELRELAASSPAAARAVISLYRNYRGARDNAQMLAARLTEGDVQAGGADAGADRSRLPSEEVSDFVQRHMNHFPAIEEAAEQVWREARLEGVDRYHALARYLEKTHGVTVRVVQWGESGGMLRRYDPRSRVLMLSELLPTRSRSFQLAQQAALLSHRPLLERLSDAPELTTPDSRALSRVAMASYFAGAVLMPYQAFLDAARGERYDIDVLGRRFRVGFEQVCHRLTSLSRPGQEGVPFHMIRLDIAGNISKRFSASGIRIARYAGACPRWNVFAAFTTPGVIRIQVSSMGDGSRFFCIARTLQKDSAGYHAQQPMQAIGLGCRAEFARELVYSDGVDLGNESLITPVGVTCRLCERTDCTQRALPSLQQPLRVDENVRGATLYTRAG